MEQISAWVVVQIEWIMLLSGLLTSTMVYAFIAPKAALRSMFGEVLDWPLAEVVVRNWGALITLVGILLIWGSFYPDGRSVIVFLAVASKLVFVGLVLANGTYFLRQQVGIAALIDVMFVALFAIYLLA
jgi:hypothetical protein